MSQRARIRLIVAACALGAAGLAVGATLLQSQKSDHATVASAKPQPGYPPLALDLGVRVDPQAQALRAAISLYAAKRYTEAAKAFERYDSPEARVGAAFSEWPHGGLGALERLAREDPGSSLVLLHLGLARYWAGQQATAVDAWRIAERVQPDTLSAVHAADLLHPGFARGLPEFVPSFAPPADVSYLPPDKGFAVLESRARTGGWRDKIVYGVALQRLGRPVSAEREFKAAAKESPNDPDAQVAAAVGLFSKDDPSLAFGRLGPLSRRFPHAPTVRFHLGLMLVWMGQVGQAKKELELAIAEGPATSIGRQAAVYLQRIQQAQGG